MPPPPASASGATSTSTAPDSATFPPAADDWLPTLKSSKARAKARRRHEAALAAPSPFKQSEKSSSRKAPVAADPPNDLWPDLDAWDGPQDQSAEPSSSSSASTSPPKPNDVDAATSRNKTSKYEFDQISKKSSRHQGKADASSETLTTKNAVHTASSRSPPQQPHDLESEGSGAKHVRSQAHVSSGGHDESQDGLASTDSASRTRPARRPSRQHDSHVQAGHDSRRSEPRGRPTSMPHTYMHRGPAPTHMVPSHFYGVHPNDVDALHGRRMSRDDDDLTDFLALDSLSDASDKTTESACNVLLQSQGPNLFVYRIENASLVSLGSLLDLRGYVVSAKILPSGLVDDPLLDLRPLIALVLHGPSARENSSPSRASSRGSQTSNEDHPPPVSEQSAEAHTKRSCYQTTVEVYSLANSTHVATLFKSAHLPIEYLPGHRTPVTPSPAGQLRLQAQGRFITLASAASGEVFIYAAAASPSEPSFRCIGKAWTTISRPKPRTWSTSSTSEHEQSSESSPSRTSNLAIALTSLSSRWLAIAPPSAALRTAIPCRIPLSPEARSPPGLSSHAAPPSPPVTCELDTPLEESRLNKVARDVTQEVIKGARWVGDQGLQAWKSYWNKPTDLSPNDRTMPNSPAHHQFPPTHAPEPSARSASEACLVSVLDLEDLASAQEGADESALAPMATFQLPGGCSLLSFNPSGLALLTASAKGDVQHVWDLLQAVHTSTATHMPRPSVRQIASYVRVTVANIRDAVWHAPTGQRFAVVTDRGTVHIHDLPPHALRWPPLPRQPAASPQTEMTPVDSPPSTSPPGRGWAATFQAVSSNAQPILTAVRKNPLAGFGSLTLSNASAGATAAAGGKIMASGLSKSVGAAAGTVQTIRHMGENRVHLPPNAPNDYQDVLRWLPGPSGGTLILLGGEVLRFHKVDAGGEGKHGKRRRSVISSKYHELQTPSANATDSAAHRRSDSEAVHGSWPEPTVVNEVIATVSPLAHAEIETCAPYQPFHADRGVILHVYADDADVPRATAAGDDDSGESPWAFGTEIAVTSVASCTSSGVAEANADADTKAGQGIKKDTAKAKASPGIVELTPEPSDADEMNVNEGTTLDYFGGITNEDLLEPFPGMESIVQERETASHEPEIVITTRRKRMGKKKQQQQSQQRAKQPMWNFLDGNADESGLEENFGMRKGENWMR